jgi:hypothetical protein
MTKKEAKELSLKVWRYLAEHPETARKRDLPGELYGAIRNLSCACPLCELFFTRGIFFEVRILWRKNFVRSQVA